MALNPRRTRATRTIAALMLREMSTTYGRSAMGYLWAVLEPVAGIILLTFVFSLALRAPSLGTSFPLFYASGMLPFMAYMDLNAKLAKSLQFSRQLLFYPGVTFIDALLARLLLNTITQAMVSALVLTSILFAYDLDVILDPAAIALAYSMMLALAVGVGTLNCFLLSSFPFWERAWAILNRPMFIISCIFFLFESVPQPWRDYLWWNPLVHIVGQTRVGIYATYDGAYVSPLYVFLLSMSLTATGLLLLRRYYSDIVNN
ncbi:MAG: ABC transporter permease [Rhodobacteraceae bacterium]|nr:ABC transporter permease [Paracoccaceae bacterium]